jgi:hypothetical protein
MAFLTCLLSGCVLITDRWTLTDLQFQHARVVWALETADLRESADSTLPDFPVLEVDFSNPTVDLYRFARNGGFYVGETGSLCPDGKSYHASNAVGGFAYVYGALGEVEPKSESAPIKAPTRSYRAYISMTGRLQCDSLRCSPGYDLARLPAPICFFLDGGAMLGPAIRSNVMSVPESAVRDAILEYQRRDATHAIR